MFHMPAVYCRLLCALGSGDDLDSKLISELRQIDSKIGISAQALVGLRWEIAEPAAPLAEVSDDRIARMRQSVRAVAE